MAYLVTWRNETSGKILLKPPTLKVDKNQKHEDNKVRDTGLPTTAANAEGEDIDVYLKQMRQILEAYPRYGTPPDPSIIIDNLYLGTTSNADNLALLRRFDIKYLLNCSGISILRPDREMRHYKNTSSPVVEYEELNIESGETYDISRHFVRAHHFIEHARNRGRILVFCPDVDRSGAICISYLIKKGYSLLQATKIVKHARNAALFNKGFMKRLIIFARDRGMLDRCRPHLGAMQINALMKIEECPSRSHIAIH